MSKTPHLDSTARDSFRDFPLADADQCVKCALCLPHCPTYKLSRHEGDSPRGRIALMQGLAQDVIGITASTTAHLDGCLVCRACEPVCPADVPYGRLIDAGRTSLWRAGHRPGRFWKALAFMRRTPFRLAWLNRLLRWAHRSGLANLVARLPFGRAARAATYLRNTGRPPRHGSHGQGPERVALFLGCVARPLDAKVHRAAVHVLTAMGFAVEIPAAQVCCGAMDAHAGDRDTARFLATQNVAAFPGGLPVLTTASGCGVQLADYRELADIDTAAGFSRRVYDIMQFIAAHADRLPALRAVNANAVLHLPCSLRNGMRASGALEVLRRIPELELATLAHHDCCGAAGTYLFEHPETADRLGSQLIDALSTTPRYLLTGNTGCALHIAQLAEQRGLSLEVAHPVELIAAALPQHAL